MKAKSNLEGVTHFKKWQTARIKCNLEVCLWWSFKWKTWVIVPLLILIVSGILWNEKFNPKHSKKKKRFKVIWKSLISFLKCIIKPIYIHIHIYTQTHIHYIFIYLHSYTYTHTYMCMDIHTYAQICIHIRIYVHAHMHIGIYKHMCANS